MNENEKKQTGILVYEKTFGNVQANVWANRRKSGHYSFRVSLKKIVGSNRGILEYKYAFLPTDLNDLMLVLTEVEKWFKNPILIGESEKEEKMVFTVQSSQPENVASKEEPKLNELRGFFSKN